jgi:endonuclease YncB( thermonuclease family)
MVKAPKPTVIAVVLLLAPAVAIAGEFTGKIVRVIDGDSISVMHEGKLNRSGSMVLSALRRDRHSVSERSRLPHRWYLVMR